MEPLILRSLLSVTALTILLAVVMAVMIAITPSRRRDRIGVWLLACWCSAGLSIHSLYLVGEPLPTAVIMWWRPLGMLSAAWALWDVSRLARQHGTSTLAQAAAIARGIILDPKVEAGLWAQYAAGLPQAALVKGPDGVMLCINRHYENKYGKHAKHYVGETDSKMWGDDIGESFRGNDADVFRLGTPVVVKEPAPLSHDPNREAMILKFPVRDFRGAVVGVGGIELMHHEAIEYGPDTQA